MSLVHACIRALVACAVAFSFAGAVHAAGEQDAALLDAAMRGDSATVRSLVKQKSDVNAATADGTSVLHWVVRRDDLDTATLLIKAGADAKHANTLGVTPLEIACHNGNGKMVRALLDAGADANASDRARETMLMAAAGNGSEEAVKALLDHGAAVDAREPAFQQTALMFAARKGNDAAMRVLIEHGADVNAQTRVGEAPEFRLPGAGGGSHGIGIVRGGWPKRGMRNPQPGGLTPLLYAVREGHLKSVKQLLDAGADIDKGEANGITPLIMAITNNRIDVARLLIDRKADINQDDWYGRTPLWAAVETRNMDGTTPENAIPREPVFELIEMLLEHGADPNARTREVTPVRRFRTGLGSLSWVDFTGQTPFLAAALSGDVDVMRLLLKYKADPNIATFAGTTPLMAAAGVNWVFFQTYDEGPEKLLEAVKMCQELGADVNARNSMGLQAVHGAANRGSNDIIKYLVGKGATLDMADNEGRTAYNWAEGVFLATNTPAAKPETMALIKELGGKVGTPNTLVSNDEGEGAGPPARGTPGAGRRPAPRSAQ